MPCLPGAGKYWCWVHWDLELMTYDFMHAKELLLRAWDETMNTQPAIITWNLMGMMNNCFYRCVRVWRPVYLQWLVAGQALAATAGWAQGGGRPQGLPHGT